MQYKQNTEEILNLLKCVECGAYALSVKKNVHSNWTDYDFHSGDFCLICDNCRIRFPITDDGIPILWTSQIKAFLKDEKKIDSNERALFANIRHYNRISDNYSVNFRRDDSLAKRIKVGAALLLPALSNAESTAMNDKYHLDMGCGPGHVLEWLSGITNKQIGLDVSLANLRNARKSTGAFVVLGDATNMPFRDNVFSLVSESSVLHHIFDWKKAVSECCRVCSKADGGILYDSEPTFESLSFSLLARFIFEIRWPAYKILSYFSSKKIHFRNIALAKEYYQTAEVHNQPGRGFFVKEIVDAFNSSDFAIEVFLSPNEDLHKRQTVPWKEASWKRIVLHLLSGHNPLLSKYGSFTLLALPKQKRKVLP